MQSDFCKGLENCDINKGDDVPKIIEIYSDGAARGNPGPAGAGAIVKDEFGNVLVEISEYLGETTNNVAEYMALILALEQLERILGSEDKQKAIINIFLDSELVVKQLKNEYKVKSGNLIPLFMRVKKHLQNFRSVNIKHVYRDENKRADELANKAIDNIKESQNKSDEKGSNSDKSNSTSDSINTDQLVKYKPHHQDTLF